MFKSFLLVFLSLNIASDISGRYLHPLLPERRNFCSAGNKLCPSRYDEILSQAIPVGVPVSSEH
jgi:hypothetical protein